MAAVANAAIRAATLTPLVVYVTTPSREVSTRVASALLDAHLAACVNIVPGVSSMYHWEGKIESDAEHMLIIKSHAGVLEQLTRTVQRMHPYDEPEVLAMPVVGGSKKFLKWLAESVSAPTDSEALSEEELANKASINLPQEHLSS